MRHIETYGYGVLAALLLVSVAELSFDFDEPWETAASAVLTGSIYLVGLMSVATSRTRLIIGLVLGAAALADEATNFFRTGSAISTAGDAVGIAFLAFVSVCLTVDMLTQRGRVVTQLLAAVCLYILMAILFSRVYLVIDGAFAQGAFSGTAPGVRAGRLTGDEALYYSFTTQTTLGFGDISPVAKPARAVSVVHATLGVLYIAVVVSSVTSARRPEDQPPGRARPSGGA